MLLLKMFIGIFFSLGMVGFSIFKKQKGWLGVSIVAVPSAIIFLGQFVYLIGDK